MKKFLLSILLVFLLCHTSFGQPIGGGMIGGPPIASESTAGVAKLATNTDATTGTNNTKIMSPADVAAAIAAISGIGASETYDSGWNGDPYASQKNDIYDYLHQFDVDDDGDIDTIDATYWATKLNASEKAAASGVASLDGSSLVVQNPANATATPTASKIPISSGTGKLDSWITTAAEGVSGISPLATDAETVTGTSDTVVTTPGNITAKMAAPGEQGLTTPYIDHSRRPIKTVSSTPVTLTLPEIANGVVWITTGASVVVLPTAGATYDGATVKFRSIAAIAFSVDNTAQVTELNGTDLASGFKVTASGVTGEEISFTWDNTASKWRTTEINGVFIDGGA